MNVSLEQIVNSNYIKYTRLTELVNEVFKGSNDNHINIYIDLYSVLKPLYANNNYDIVDYAALTSCIINMVAHYREFFRTRYDVDSTFFIVYSKNCPYVNNQFYPKYNNGSKSLFEVNKKIDDMINSNLELLRLLCPYIPNVYFVEGTFETGVLILDCICRAELINHSPNVIITKDIYNYQLVSIKDKTLILRPSKKGPIDESYYITPDNVINLYLEKRKVKTRNTLLFPGLMSLIMALSSVPERNIKSLMNISSVMKLLTKAVGDYKILNGYNSNTTYIWNGISLDNIGFETFDHRFKAIDILSQHSIFMNTPECKGIKFLDLNDPETVRSINNNYFKKYPLDLNRL